MPWHGCLALFLSSANGGGGRLGGGINFPSERMMRVKRDEEEEEREREREVGKVTEARTEGQVPLVILAGSVGL